jgi:hypothetical protein
MSASLNSADPNPGHASAIRICMIRRERWEFVKFILWIFLSLPGTLFDALFLSGIVYVFGPFQYGMSWRHLFYWCIPGATLLFWAIDRNTPESVFETTYGGGASLTTSEGHIAMSPWIYETSRGSSAMPVLTEFLLMGPRVSRKAFQRLRGAWVVRSANRDDAEKILRSLLAVDHGLDTENLLQKPVAQFGLLRAIAYLLFHGWVDSSHNTGHIWLTEDSRSVLESAIGKAR